MLSEAIVLLAVLAKPHPTPCKTLKAIIAATVVKKGKYTEAANKIIIPPIKIFFRPTESRRIPAIGLNTIAARVVAPNNHPNIASVPPITLACRGKVGKNRYHPKNINKLIIMITIKSLDHKDALLLFISSPHKELEDNLVNNLH